MDFDSDCLKVVLVFLGGEGECYSNVGEIFRQFSYGAIMSVHCPAAHVVFVVGPSSMFLLNIPPQWFVVFVLCAVGFVPLGPSTVTILDRMWTLTLSGTTIVSSEKMYFILSS